MKRNLLFAFVFLYLASTSAVSFANDYLENIIQSCANDGSVKSIGFGAIKTKPASHDAGSNYYLAQEYENDAFYKKSEGYEKIWFYSTVQKNSSGETPKYIWHLIAVPAEIQRQYSIRGYISAESIDEAVKREIITNSDKYYLIDNHSFYDYNGGKLRFYTNNAANEATIKRGINTIWEKLLSHRNMNAVYFEINKETGDGHLYYDFTFILYPVKANPENINTTRGYLIPTSKLVRRRGKVFGLVLNEKSECLAYKTLELK